MDQLIEKSPYYTPATIAKSIYNLDKDTQTVGVGAVLLVRDDIPADTVYALTKDIFDNAPKLVSSHAKYAEVNLEYGASIKAVPYHPGSAKYFTEKGFTVPSK